MEVDGKILMSVDDINEVSGIVTLYTSPMRGYRPASGIIGAVSVSEYAFVDKNYERNSTTTTAPTTTIRATTRKSDHEVLWTDNHNDYFKVKISPGTNMVSGVTSSTCQAHGMRALCSGSAGCHFNSAHCLMSPFSGPGCGEDVRGWPL